MNPVLTNVSEKVEQLLDEIHLLKAEWDGAQEDSVKAINIHCEIHRKFAIIEWIRSLVDKRCLKERATSVGGWESSNIAKTWTLVAAARKNAKATRDDLKAMRIPSIRDSECEGSESEQGRRVKVKKEAENDYFPFYMDLPPLLVRDKILGYLTFPQDKLNMVKSIPSEGQLMRWDLTTLLFESVLPILMKHRKVIHGWLHCPLLNWKDMYTLSRVTPYTRAVINKDYEDKLLKDLDHLENDNRDFDVMDLLEEVGNCHDDDPEWCRLSPYPTQIHLDFKTSKEGRRNKQLAILKRVGSRIWDCTLSFITDESPLKTLEKLGRVLGLIPHVRTLKYNHYEGESESTEWHVRDIESAELPELSSLKILTLDGDGESGQFDLIMRKLLEKYGRTLQTLMINGQACTTTPDTSIWKVTEACPCPVLTSIGLDFMSEGNIQDAMLHLSMFVESPLKIVRLERCDRNAKFHLPTLLTFLSIHFGETLEQLSLLLDNVDEPLGQGPQFPPTWMADLKFPKVKQLVLDGFPRPYGWTFILLFPALEQITFEGVYVPMGPLFEDKDILELSFDWGKMRQSNIWKLLPRLEVYELDCIAMMSYENADVEEGCVTRKDCLGFEQEELVKSPMSSKCFAGTNC